MDQITLTREQLVKRSMCAHQFGGGTWSQEHDALCAREAAYLREVEVEWFQLGRQGCNGARQVPRLAVAEQRQCNVRPNAELRISGTPV
jgi:hypothetical protein